MPTLKKGGIVVLDNLSSHKGKAVRAAGAHLLFLPRYSPDLNPIEMMFAKIKGLLRREECRSIPSLWRCIGQLLDTISPAECSAYLRHAGYAA